MNTIQPSEVYSDTPFVAPISLHSLSVVAMTAIWLHRPPEMTDVEWQVKERKRAIAIRSLYPSGMWGARISNAIQGALFIGLSEIALFKISCPWEKLCGVGTSEVVRHWLAYGEIESREKLPMVV